MLSRIVLNCSRPMSGPVKSSTTTAWKAGMAGLGVFSVGGLAYSLKHALAPSESAMIHQAAVWPKYVRERLSGTFGYCLAGLGFTGVGAMAASRSATAMRLFGGNSMMSFFGCLVLMMGSGYACQMVPFNGSPLGLKAALYYGHMAIVGGVITPVLMMGGPVCIRAGAATLAIMAGLATTAMVAPNDAYIKMYGPINAGMFLMLGACVASFVAPPMGAFALGLESFIMLGGLALFTAKGFMDLQKAADKAQSPGAYDPVNHSLHITMDMVNIFIRLVMLMSGNRRK